MLRNDEKAELQRLREDVSRHRERLEHVARVVDAGYRENLFWLRKLHASSAVYLGDHTAATFLSNGCRAFIDTRSRDVGVHLLHSGTWETDYTEAFKRLLRPGAKVLDVGANLGWYALVAAPILGPAGRVFAVEPNPGLARLVYDSLRTNGFGAFSRVFQVAVGDAPGVVDLFARPDMPGGGFIRPAAHDVADPPKPAVRVASVPLDDLLAAETGPIDAVKMDVEAGKGWRSGAWRAPSTARRGCACSSNGAPCRTARPRRVPKRPRPFRRGGTCPSASAPAARWSRPNGKRCWRSAS